jgi:hypothetical protein
MPGSRANAALKRRQLHRSRIQLIRAAVSEDERAEADEECREAQHEQFRICVFISMHLESARIRERSTERMARRHEG